MIAKLFPYRFELVFVNLVAILFGSLVLPPAIYDPYILDGLMIIFILVGMVFISKRQKLFRLFAVLLILLTVFSVLSTFDIGTIGTNVWIRSAIVFPFIAIVTYELIHQIWVAKIINKNMILGVMSGYMCLGFMGTLLFIAIESFFPGSFYGNLPEGAAMDDDNLLYLSYITLMSIGYGDFGPVTMLAKKAAMLIGMAGQFYMVIVIAVVVSKYVNAQEPTND